MYGEMICNPSAASVASSSILKGNDFMDTKNIVPVEWKDQRVLTTAQLAEFYECTVENIRDNFRKNKERFIADKHFIKLEGEPLKAFRRYAENIRLPLNKFAPSLYLWTERGAARHAKMLSTDTAWDVYEELEDNYFNPSVVPAVENASAPAVEEQTNKYRVYADLLSDGNVKIGCTKRFIPRAGEVERETGLKIVDVYFTPEMSYKNAHLIEWCSKKKLAPKCVKGEIFSVEFYKAYATIAHYTKMTFAVLPTKSINLIADKQA